MIKTFTTSDLNELPSLAKEILSLAQHKIFLLVGDLGAGKTTLAQALIKELGITEKVTSPSYSIINEYHAGDLQINHIDLYRMESLEDAMQIGIEDYLYSGAPTFIEWPQLIDAILPAECHKIEIHILDKLQRRIILS